MQVYNGALPYGDRLSGHTITVANRSEVVGRPLAALLANDGAVVYSVDVTGVQQFSRGEGLRKRQHEVVDKRDWAMDDCLPLSDVVISGVPGDQFKVPTALVKEGAVCINFSSDKVRKNFGPLPCVFKYLPSCDRMLLLLRTGLIFHEEFLSGHQGASFALRAHHRQGDYRHLTAKPAGTYPPVGWFCKGYE